MALLSMSSNGLYESQDDEILEATAVDPPSNMLTVHNVLASAMLSCSDRLDLDKCCSILGNSYYNPGEFPALRIDVRGKQSAVYTISLFESGRIQSTGGCRPVEAKKAMMKICRRLKQKLNYKIIFQNFEIQNVLAVFDACCPVSLGTFAGTFKGNVDYEPDRFPAARVRISVPQKKLKANIGKDSVIREECNYSNEDNVSVKLRKLMMGDAVSGEHDTELSNGGVGSYIISAGAKRLLTSRNKEEKQNKEECVTANVFSTGKITFTGAKSIGSLNYALEKLKPAIGIRNDCFGFLLPSPLSSTIPSGSYNHSLSEYPLVNHYKSFHPQHLRPYPTLPTTSISHSPSSLPPSFPPHQKELQVQIARLQQQQIQQEQQESFLHRQHLLRQQSVYYNSPYQNGQTLNSLLFSQSLTSPASQQQTQHTIPHHLAYQLSIPPPAPLVRASTPVSTITQPNHFY